MAASSSLARSHECILTKTPKTPRFVNAGKCFRIIECQWHWAPARSVSFHSRSVHSSAVHCLETEMRSSSFVPFVLSSLVFLLSSAHDADAPLFAGACKPTSSNLHHQVHCFFWCATTWSSCYKSIPSRGAGGAAAATIMNQQLLDAAQGGDLARVEQALQNGANLEFKDNLGKTPLHLACLCGHLAVVGYLLLYSSDENLLKATDTYGDTPLHCACNQGHLDIVRYLLTSRGANLEATDDCGLTSLHWACSEYRFDVVRYLLTSHDANLEATDEDGNTPLHFACQNGEYDLVQYLLNSHGANLNARNNEGTTPLHKTAYCHRSNMEIVRLLFYSNRDSIFAQDKDGDTPLDSALQTGRHDIVNYLLDRYREAVFEREGHHSIHSVLRGATYTNDGNGGLKALLPIGKLPETQLLNLLRSLLARSSSAPILQIVDSENGDTPLHIACKTRAPISVVRLLVETNALPVQIANRSIGALPIHVACDNRAAAREVIQLLVESGGADTLQKRDSSGALPVHIACGAGALDSVIRLLAEGGGAVTLQERDGNGALPIHASCRAGAALESIQLLVNSGGAGTLQERDINGDLPIHSACRAGAGVAVIRFLVEKGGVCTLAAMDRCGSLPLHLFCGSGPSLEAVQSLGRWYPGYQLTRNRSGDWPLLTAASLSSSSSLEVIYYLLRSNPGVADAEEL